MWMGLATGLTLSEVSVAGLLGIRESSSYSFGRGTGVCWSGEDMSHDQPQCGCGATDAAILFFSFTVE